MRTLISTWARDLLQLSPFPWDTYDPRQAAEVLSRSMAMALRHLVPEPIDAAAVVSRGDDQPVVVVLAELALYLITVESYADGETPRMSVVRELLDERVAISVTASIQKGSFTASRISASTVWRLELPRTGLLEINGRVDEDDGPDPQQVLACAIAAKLEWDVPMSQLTAEN